MESGKRQGTVGTRYGKGRMRDGRQANCDSSAIRVSEENGGLVVIGYMTQDGFLNILSKRTRNCYSICGVLVSRGKHRFILLLLIKFLMHASFLEDKLIIRV